jgi:Cu/Ag efflux protein CusF
MLNKPNLLAARFLLCSCVLLVFSAACNRSKPQPETSSSAAKRYPFKGKIISVDKNASTANIDNEPIAGFMDPMIMPYSFKPASALDQLQPGDTITADVVVQAADNKYWLENVKVVSHTDTPASKPTATMHIPAPGDDVPDFHLINQNGSASRCINIAVRLCSLRLSTHAVHFPTSAHASATNSPPSITNSAPIPLTTAKLTC